MVRRGPRLRESPTTFSSATATLAAIPFPTLPPGAHPILLALLIVNTDETDDMNRVETTVFELAGPDRAGLLAEVTHLLTHNGCNVRSAAVSIREDWRGTGAALGSPARACGWVPAECLQLRRAWQ